jgi:hypothetical protein
MIKSVLISALLVLGVQANAATTEPIMTNSIVQSLAMRSIHPESGLDWVVGDYADYNLSGGIINGTMHTFIREAVDQGFWIEQDMDLGFMGKQKVETLIDKNSGKVLELLVNGEKQTPPDPSDSKVIDSKRDHITVPAGEFDCLWVKIHDNKQNQDSEVWINPTLVPIAGMLKTVAPSQMGDITVVLTGFHKSN